MTGRLLCIVIAYTLCVGCGGRDLGAFPATDSGVGSVSANCGMPGTADPFTTNQELVAKIVGRWGHCSGPKLVGIGEDASGYEKVGGLEILANGRFFVLVRSPDGGLDRGHGFDKEGKWELALDYIPAPLNTATLTFIFDGTLGGGASVAFRKQPRLARIREGNYAALP